MSELNAVIWDCDGVLVDSRESNIALFQGLLAEGGLDADREVIQTHFHLSLRATLKELLADGDDAEITRIATLAEDPSYRRPDLFTFPTGLHTVLGELHRSYQMAVATSRIRIGLEDVFKTADIRYYFDANVVFEDYVHPKPDPEPLLLAASRLEVAPSESVYIGDSISDIESARRAGMMSIHLAAQKHADATIGITDFSQIPDAVRSLDS